MDTDTLKYLKNLPLLKGLPEEAISRMAGKMGRRKLVKDEVLLREGDPGDSLFLIRTGWVKIVTEDAQGNEMMLNQYGPAEVVGELALIDGEPRSASVIALSPVEVLELQRAAFLEELEEQPLLALNVMRTLAERLRFASTYIQKAIEWSRHISEGNYGFAIEQIQTTQTTIVDSRQTDEARALALLSAFFKMIEDVRKREEQLRRQVRRLTIRIDDVKRQQEVEDLTESTFFAGLKSTIRDLRRQRKTDKD